VIAQIRRGRTRVWTASCMAIAACDVVVFVVINRLGAREDHYQWTYLAGHCPVTKPRVSALPGLERSDLVVLATSFGLLVLGMVVPALAFRSGSRSRSTVAAFLLLTGFGLITTAMARGDLQHLYAPSGC
jgi:hypothetical protein